MAATSPEILRPPVEFRALHRHAPMSATKARPVLPLIRGRKVDEAIVILRHTAKRAAPLVRKVLQSAVANAEKAVTDGKLDVDLARLFVARAWIDEGGIIYRWSPAARGSATPIRRRRCHIHVLLREAPEEGKKGED